MATLSTFQQKLAASKAAGNAIQSVRNQVGNSIQPVGVTMAVGINSKKGFLYLMPSSDLAFCKPLPPKLNGDEVTEKQKMFLLSLDHQTSYYMVAKYFSERMIANDVKEWVITADDLDSRDEFAFAKQTMEHCNLAIKLVNKLVPESVSATTTAEDREGLF